MTSCNNFFFLQHKGNVVIFSLQNWLLKSSMFWPFVRLDYFDISGVQTFTPSSQITLMPLSVWQINKAKL